MKVRTIDLVFLVMLFWILGDVADPVRHPDLVGGVTAHSFYNWCAAGVLLFAMLRPKSKS